MGRFTARSSFPDLPIAAALAVALTSVAAVGCRRGDPAEIPSGDPAFDARWRTATAADGEVFYVGDDRAEAMLGTVRKGLRPRPSAPPAAGRIPEQLPGEEVQQVIRSNLPAVKGCYLGMARQGSSRSGKAIVTFAVGSDGRPSDVKVDAPAFQGTALPGCLTAQVGFWSFPRSQKGGGVVSYPFVFVGG
jgi:hypothetical protein